jgi:aspartate/methionine/tyrosine aminotransferase
VVALARPGYPAYRNIVKALDMKVHYINTEIKNNFQLTPKLVKALPKNIKGIIVSSPSNPCGSIISNNDMREITEICKRKNIRVISDEIYHKVEYDNKKLDTAFKMDSSSIVINSFSKYFLMTGYRLGWVLGDKKFINRIRNLSMNFYLSPSSISQHVGQTVFRYYDYFDEVVLSYLENRNFLINALNNIGLSNFILPKGAFYIYLDSSKVHKNSYDFCKKMVNDIGVTAAPGIDFDDLNGKNYLRLSYSCSRKDLEEGINRIKEWI